MINFISEMPDVEAMCKIENCHLHDYHKDARAGRKVGHATIIDQDNKQLQNKIDEALLIMQNHL